MHEPRAAVLHRFNQSAAGEPRAAEWFAESAERFARRHYGPLFRALLRRLPPAAPAPPAAAAAGDDPFHVDLAPLAAARPCWIEVSPRPAGFPAAAERLPAEATAWRLPDEIRDRLPPGPWWLRVCDDGGGELSCRTARA